MESRLRNQLPESREIQTKIKIFYYIVPLLLLATAVQAASTLNENGLNINSFTYNDTGQFYSSTRLNSKEFTTVCRSTGAIDDLIKQFTCDYVCSYNSNDCTSTFSNALNSDKRIYIKEGNYNASRINITTNNTELYCANLNTQINLISNTNDSLFYVNSSNAKIQNCYISESTNSLINKGLIHVYSNDVKIIGNKIELEINANDGDGIRFDSDANYGLAEQNQFIGGRNGVFFYNQNTITNNHATKQGHLCFFGRIGRYNIVAGNICENSSSGIGFEADTAAASYGNTIANNIVRYAWGGSGVTLGHTDHNTVTGNSFFNLTYDGIRLNDSRYNTISNNVMDNFRYGIILLNEGGTSIYNSFIANVCYDTSNVATNCIRNENASTNYYNTLIGNKAEGISSAIVDTSISNRFDNFDDATEKNLVVHYSEFRQGMKILKNLSIDNSVESAIIFNSTTTGISVNQSYGRVSFYGSDTSSMGTGEKAYVRGANEGSFGNAGFVEIGTSPTTQNTSIARVKIDSFGTVSLYNYTGATGGYICVYANGTLYRNATCP